MLKKLDFKYIITFIFLLSMCLMPYFVFAQSEQGVTKSMLEILGKNAGYETGAERNNIWSITSAVINGILGILGILLFSYMFYGGYLWMTAQGNDEQVQKAKSIIRNAIIGLIIILASYGIANYVITALLEPGGSAPGNIQGT